MVKQDQRFATDTAALQQSFLSAPFSKTGWDDALRLLAATTRSGRAQLIGVGRDAARFNFMPDVDPRYHADFEAVEGHRPDINWRIAATATAMQVVSERQYDAVRQTLRSEAYDAHCHRWDAINGCQTALIQRDDLLIGLATLRSEREGRMGARELAIFNAGAQYALAAVRMQKTMAERNMTMLAATLETMGVNALLMDRMGRVGAMSAGMDQMIAMGALVRITAGRLYAVRSDTDSALQDCLHRVLTGEGGSVMNSLWLSPKSGLRSDGAVCDLFRLPANVWDVGFEASVLVVIRSAKDIPATRLASLRAALGLTHAEAEIAHALANGACRDRIAADRETSPATLKSQIKSILRKADADREAGLVALINRTMRG